MFVEVVVVSGFPGVLCTEVFVVTVTEGINALIGAVTVSTSVLAALVSLYLCPGRPGRPSQDLDDLEQPVGAAHGDLPADSILKAC